MDELRKTIDQLSTDWPNAWEIVPETEASVNLSSSSTSSGVTSFTHIFGVDEEARPPTFVVKIVGVHRKPPAVLADAYDPENVAFVVFELFCDPLVRKSEKLELVPEVG